MSQQNLELWRASIEAEFSFRADRSEFDPEATISKMAELWDPELELDISEFEGPDIGGGVYRGAEAVRRFWREWFAAWGDPPIDGAFEALDEPVGGPRSRRAAVGLCRSSCRH